MNNQRITIFILALSLLSYGILTSEHLRVWRKAATICLECIGIG